MSAVQLVADLEVGEAYAKAVYLPATEFSPERVKDAKRKLMHTLSSVVARVRADYDVQLRIFTTHGFTNTYDVVVTGIIVREDDEL